MTSPAWLLQDSWTFHMLAQGSQDMCPRKMTRWEPYFFCLSQKFMHCFCHVHKPPSFKWENMDLTSKWRSIKLISFKEPVGLDILMGPSLEKSAQISFQQLLGNRAKGTIRGLQTWEALILCPPKCSLNQQNYSGHTKWFHSSPLWEASHAPLPSPLPTPSAQQPHLYSCELLAILFVCPVRHNQLVVKQGHLLNKSQHGSTPFYYNREKRFHNCEKAKETGEGRKGKKQRTQHK